MDVSTEEFIEIIEAQIRCNSEYSDDLVGSRETQITNLQKSVAVLSYLLIKNKLLQKNLKSYCLPMDTRVSVTTLMLSKLATVHQINE